VLEGLMSFLSDPNREIRVAAHKAMTVGRGWLVMMQEATCIQLPFN
jgi:hypothetical protein